MSDDSQGTNSQESSNRQQSGLLGFLMRDKISSVLWLTRIFTIFFTLMYFIPIIGGHPVQHYNKALLAAGATSALRLHQRLPRIQFSREFAGRLFAEDSAHYLFFVLIFMSNSPFTMVLVPIFLFALLHSAKFTVDLMNQSGPNSMPLIRNLLTKLQAQQVSILRFIAVTEIFLMPLVVFMIFSGKAMIFLPFLYYRFLSLRYASVRNPYSKQLFYELRITAERLVYDYRCPEFIRKFVHKFIAFVISRAPAPSPAPTSN
ncbi:DgyrCDS8869 [Dimorphilus gyrociliatus]|uniref:DgyrCDS8869 n=1 Tax=Dimorphilus gyrociliatus TaxID=2664684 RepID=A0A7I8VXQ8_9ANNE|nr:DgyrCDS8869 [Dimorphilus gyrociliatus]